MGNMPTYEELEKRIQELEKVQSEFIREQKSLKESQTRFQLLYDRAPLAYQSLDESGNFIVVNTSWLNILGYKREEVIGKPFADFLHPDWKDHFKENFPRFKAVGEVLGVEFEMVKKDGSLILVSFHGKIGKDTLGNFQQTHCIFQDITQRYKTEMELQKTKRLLDDSQKIGKTGGWEVNPTTGDSFWTDNQYRLFGYEPGEIKNRQQFFMEKIVHPDDRKRMSDLFQRVFEKKQEISTEYRVVRKDGKERIIYAVVVPEYDEYTGHILRIYGSNLDITERKLSEEVLRKEKEFTDLAMDSQRDTFFLFDPKTGKAIRWNRAFSNISGYSDDEIAKNKAPNAYYSPEDLKRAEKFIADVLEKGFGQIELNLICKNGHLIPTEYNVSVITDDKDQPKYFISVGRDVTERKQLQAQLAQALKMEAIGTLAGGIAHDFNNILGIIIGNAELAFDTVPEWNPASQNLGEIKTACLRARDVVRQLLSFSRKTEQLKKPIQVNDIISESMKLLRASIPATIDIKVNIPDKSQTIEADATQIHQVLINLCTNASHAMEKSGGELIVTVSKLIVDEKTSLVFGGIHTGPYICLEVSDTGVGISPAVKKKMFDPYFTTKEIGKGTGMGLAVVLGVVETHNGGIAVKSQPGKGTSVKVVFPIVKEQEAVSIQPSRKLLKGKETILLIDDEKAIIKMERQMLERLGYTLVTSTAPDEALKLFSQNPSRFDLIITDMTMPKMTGDTLAKKMIKIRPDIPVILCTGFSEKINGEASIKMGIKKYIEKPIKLKQIAKMIRDVLDDN